MDPVTIVMTLLLDDFPNAELAALNISVRTSGTVKPRSISFERAKDAGLIDDTGKPVDLETLRDALDFTVNERFAADTSV